jgi:hypothetical protein
MKYLLGMLAGTALVMLLLGCESGPTDEELGVSSPEGAVAESVKADVEDLQSMLEAEGVRALASEMESFMENLEGYESDPGAAQSADTFAKLKQAAQELQTLASGSATEEAVKAKIDEMLSLADSLPK